VHEVNTMSVSRELAFFCLSVRSPAYFIIADFGKGEVVPVLFFNRAPRHEGVLGNEGIVPRIL
jgi:hypothetical protein